MKSTFKVLLLLLFTTTIYSFGFNEILESDCELIENDISIKCGFLEVKSRFKTNKIVRATRAGCFRWEYSKNGKVIAVSEIITIKQGETKRGFSNNGETVKIRCSCRNQSRSVRPNY
ncbi:hypothetical protein JQC67_13670 [Aurantibacter crassamenti]|uniref:hypothetical protein n=1 Tax=Aurantibacter crassamenti TaxID=1837375 RepID=UPI0019397B5F|nr:hypothetical protein [Aurantibacter crassamenti]MBM1107197.1 hypothetical protein [Aurantibacter crassamenti]